MIILGLTGSIGMGKSTTAMLFKREGVPVFDSDAIVHDLYQNNEGLIKAISHIFPDAVCENKINRKILGDLIRAHPQDLQEIENIVHPAVAEVRKNWLEHEEKKRTPIVLFDIPLLFETGSENRVDKIVVVTTSSETQKMRVLERPGMTDAHFKHLLSRQTPDEEKRQRADFIIDTSKGLEVATQQVQSILRQLGAK